MTTSSLDTIKAREESLLCRTYGRYPVSIASGKGSRVTDLDGKEYVDLLAGIAVTSLGHCNEEIAQVIEKQARKLIHVSNLFYQEEQLELAEELLSLSHFGKAFFCNSGAEANEAQIKLARRYMQRVKNVWTRRSTAARMRRWPPRGRSVFKTGSRPSRTDSRPCRGAI